MSNEKIKSAKCTIIIILAIVLLSAGCATIQEVLIHPKEKIKISVVNPMVKVFEDTRFPQDTTNKVLRVECAANEYEPAQFAIRASVKLEDVTVRLTDLVNKESGDTISFRNLHWNFLGFIPVQRNTFEAECGEHKYIPEGEILRGAPCKIPDPLLEVKSITLEANQTQPFWVTVYVPDKTPPGVYRGEVIVIASAFEKAIPIELTVYPLELPKERHLYITNWFEPIHIAKAHSVELYSEEFWQILNRYAQNMAQHRQNVVYTPWQLVKVYQEENGELSFDYSIFDRFVETFIQAGVSDRIELYHVAHRAEGEFWVSAKMVFHKVNVIDKETGDTISIPGEQGLPPLLKDLERHLDEKGWLEKSMIHIADEATYHNLDSWKEAARFVRKAAPKIKTIDAIGATGFGDLLDVWVPLTAWLNAWFDSYKRAQESGAELWFYTCCVPYGHYPNRFLDYPLIRLRILFWMNYAFGIEGYLHWGLTYGWEDPFGPAPRFPPGDSHIIYPGDNRPLNSIRWEMQREGLEDYEYLWLLESKINQVKKQLGPAAKSIPSDFRSKEICGKLVKSFTEYTEDSDTFYSAKKLLASEINDIGKSPLILITTDPPTNTELATGPAIVKVYGVVEKGTKVRVNGDEIQVDSIGSFLETVSPSHLDNILEVEAEKDGKKKTLKRMFIVK